MKGRAGIRRLADTCALPAPGKPGIGGKISGVIPAVARLPRVVVLDVAHHVTQRGNGRQCILATGSERMVYLYAELNVVRAGLVVGAAD